MAQTLREGDTGTEVRALQSALAGAGYWPQRPDALDGEFTASLAAAVRKFQADNGLQVDGIVGNQTWTFLETGEVVAPGGFSGSFASPQFGGEPSTGSTQDTYTGGQDRFFGLGGYAEVWHVSDTDEDLVVYFVPGFEPPIPMVWTVEKDADLDALFGPGNKVTFDKVYTSDELASTGAINFGVRTELRVTQGNPFEGFVSKWERESSVRPYLKDPEVAALLTSAALENRSPSQAEFESTEWWQTHNDAERAWLVRSVADPETAAQKRDSDQRWVRGLLEEAGVFEPDDDLVRFMAERFTVGNWTETQLIDQVNGIADPDFTSVTFMPEFVEFLESNDLEIDRNQDREQWVRDELTRWLGPVHGDWTDDEINQIAGRIRNDPNFEEQWRGTLQETRVELFPAFTNPLVSYQQIASSLRPVYTSVLGEQPDETSELWSSFIQSSDIAQAKTDLRRQGLNTGNTKVTNEALSALGASMNFGVRRAN